MKIKLHNYLLLRWGFVAYVVLLFYILVFKSFNIYELQDKINYVKCSREVGAYNYNIVPLRTIIDQFEHMTDLWALENLVGNIVCFLPFGIGLPLVTNGKKLVIVIVTGMLFSVVIELTQFFLCTGSADIDDIILNVVGCMIGYMINKYLSYGIVTYLNFGKKQKY